MFVLCHNPNPANFTQKGKTLGRGSFQPVNRLTSNETQASASLQSKHSKKAFDLHGDSHPRPDHNPIKKQKLESGWVGKTRPNGAIDDESNRARSTYYGTPMDKPERGRGLQGSQPGVSRAISPQRINRNRNMPHDDISDNKMAKISGNDVFLKPQGRYSKPEASKPSAILPKQRRPLRGDDPKDPITDADATVNDGTSKSVPKVIIQGLPGSAFHSPPSSKNMTSRNLAAAQLIDSEDSMDDLSVEHYTKPRPSLSNKRNRPESQSTQPKKDTTQAETIHDSSEEEIGTLAKGNIQPTPFPTSKKATPKIKKSGQERYPVFQMFSPKHPWLLDGKKEWFLIYNRLAGSLSIEGEKVPPYFSLTTNSISTIIYCEESSKLIVRKSADNSFGGASDILFTLASTDHSVKLAKVLAALSSTIRATPKHRFVL
jgi:hypothetical protein